MTEHKPYRAVLLAGALLATTALGACTGDDKPAGTGGPGDTGQPAAGGGLTTFTGLYVTGDVVPVSESATQVTLASGRSCQDLSLMLAAGQWRLVDRLTFGKLGDDEAAMIAGFGGVPGDLLQRGDTLVFAALEGGAACTATVTAVPRGDVTLEGGDLPGKSPGWVATTRCYRSKSSDDLTVSVYFDTDAKIGGQGQIALTKDGAGYQASDDTSALNLTLVRHQSRFLDSMSAAYAKPDQRPAGLGLSELEPGGSFAGTATLDPGTPDDAPAGVIELSGLLDPDGDDYEAQIKISLRFACPAVFEIK